MSSSTKLPRVLVIDDLYGREVEGATNDERENLCGQFLLRDVTPGVSADGRISRPVAEAVFHRGQRPVVATVGDTVENDLPAVLEVVRSGWAADGSCSWALVFLDLCFYTGAVTAESHERTPGMPEGRPNDDRPTSYFGLSVLSELQRTFPSLPVVVFSSRSRTEVSREFAEAGALGFLARDSVDGVQQLQDLLWRHGLLGAADSGIVGESRSLLLALRTARRLAGSGRNVLLRGERGTGKELFSRFIHREGGAAQTAPASFVAVNSAALSPELFSAELFGVEPRTATGVAGKVGLIEQANGGSLFLDEIRDMPLQVQAGLLRVLQDGVVTRVGGRSPQPVAVRFLSATNSSLEDLADGGHFRYDLLDRLCEGGTIQLPPLRDRRSDIPLLADAFLREAEASVDGSMSHQITPEAAEVLRQHTWPGNVRELRSAILRAVSSHPDVEYLVPGHLELEDSSEGRLLGAHEVPTKATSRSARESDRQTDELGDLLGRIEKLEFDPMSPGDWAGTLPQIQRAFAHLAATLLRASLLATRRPTPEKPEGKILIHPATKLITGDSELTAVQAADLIKRTVRLLPGLEEQFEEDPFLAAAWDSVHRIRPSRQKGSKGTGR